MYFPRTIHTEEDVDYRFLSLVALQLCVGSGKGRKNIRNKCLHGIMLFFSGSSQAKQFNSTRVVIACISRLPRFIVMCTGHWSKWRRVPDGTLNMNMTIIRR